MGSMGGQLQQNFVSHGQVHKGPATTRLTGDLGGRTSFAGRDHDQQFHDGVIDLGAAGLDNKDVLLSDAVGDLDARLALERKKDCEHGQSSMRCDVAPGR